MESQLPERKLLEDIELRQDDLIRQLDLLNERIEAVIRQWAPPRQGETAPDLKKVA